MKIPFELEGVWSFNYYINHSTPLKVFFITEQFYVVRVSEELLPSENNLEVHSAISMSHPPFGSLVHGGFNIVYRSHPMTVKSAKALLIEVKEVMKVDVAVNNDFLRSEMDIEPGSWFLSLQPLHEDQKYGHPATSYLEFVMSREKLLKHRRITNKSEKMSKTKIDMRSTSIADDNHDLTDKRRHVCIWGSNQMDGQKQIWLSQLQSFKNSDEFKFTYVLTSNTENLPSGSSVVDRIKQSSNVRVVESPAMHHPIQIEDFDQVPADGTESFASIWDGKDEDKMVKYMKKRIEIAGNHVEKVSPPWCQDFFRLLVSFLRQEACNVVVFGNNRGFSADILLVDAAKVVGATTIAELLNLFPSEDSMPDILIGPSHYSIEHTKYEMNKKQRAFQTQMRVISPAVDLDRFKVKKYQHAKTAHSIDKRNILRVAFFARLATEKNPGLFMMSAREVLDKNPYFQFVIIGDGNLRANLEELAHRLEITNAVEFLGMLAGDQLVAALQTIDIVVNPSLRAWSETFCIANIEAMATGIPLVTFGVGGIGEYIEVEEELTEGDNDDTTVGVGKNNTQYQVVKNAVLVNEASPKAIAAAILALEDDVDLRVRIGLAGRRTIESYFSIDRQINEYANLYRES